MYHAPREASKLGNLIRRLSSDHDGEIIAAVGAIRCTLECYGHTLHDLADLVERSINAHEENSALDADAQWRHDIDELLRSIRKRTQWERRFVRTVLRYRHPPSAKQLQVLAGIRQRLEEDAAHDA